MEYKDYYKIMGLKRDATLDDIKRAYRKLARKYHPDVSKEANAEERFKEVGEAYEVLKDPKKRAAYDQLGGDWRAGQEFHPPPDWSGHFEFNRDFSDNTFGGFSDFFQELFGDRGAGHYHVYKEYNMRGQDQHAKVVVDLEDAIHGTTRNIIINRPKANSNDNVQLEAHTLKVKIPKGIKQGQQIRLAGQGMSGVGKGKAGDLYIEIQFKPHKLFHVEGKDLYMKLPVAPWEVALGAIVKIPIIDGWLDLTIPANFNPNGKLRIKGRGIPGNPPGDIYINLDVVVPKADTEQAKMLYEEMREKLAFNPRANLTGYK